MGSMCQPVVLASGLTTPNNLAVDPENVYWTSGDGKIQSVPIGGGTVSTLLSGLNSPNGIAVDALHVYYTDGALGTVNQVPLAGGSFTVLASGQPGPAGVAVAATYGAVYWVNGGTAANNYAGSVMGVSFGATSPVTITGSSNYAGPVASATSLYWADARGYIGTMQFGNAPSQLAGGLQAPSFVAVGSGLVAWVDNPAAGPRVSALMSGSPTTIATAQAALAGLAVDDRYVYWTLFGSGVGQHDGQVLKAPLSGGASVAMATGQYGASAMTLDPVCIYWIDRGFASGDGAIMKVAK